MDPSPLIELGRDAQAAVERELRPGERVVWAATPTPPWFPIGTAVPALVGVPFTAFAVLWTALASGMTSGPFGGRMGHATTSPAPAAVRLLFPLWGLMFVGIGLWTLSTPLRARAALRRSTYVVTDRRAVILRRGRAGDVAVTSFEPARLDRLERRARADGAGDLIFETRVSHGHKGRKTTEYVGFLGLPDVARAEDVLRRTLLDPRPR